MAKCEEPTTKNWATPAHCRCVFWEVVDSEEVGGACSAPQQLHAESSVMNHSMAGTRSTSGISRHQCLVQRAWNRLRCALGGYGSPARLHVSVRLFASRTMTSTSAERATQTESVFFFGENSTYGLATLSRSSHVHKRSQDGHRRTPSRTAKHLPSSAVGARLSYFFKSMFLVVHLCGVIDFQNHLRWRLVQSCWKPPMMALTGRDDSTTRSRRA